MLFFIIHDKCTPRTLFGLGTRTRACTPALCTRLKTTTEHAKKTPNCGATRHGAARQCDQGQGILLVRERVPRAKLRGHGGLCGRAHREALRPAGRQLVFQSHAQVIREIFMSKIIGT